MLSAFSAQPLLELKQQGKHKIEALLLHGDRLLVGLSNGSLRIYQVNEHAPQNDDGSNGTGPSTAMELVGLRREKENFSRYKIEQLAIIKEANVLVSLSNSLISLHDLGTHDLQETFAKTKGATSFAVTSNVVRDPATDIPEIVSQLAVAIKRRVLIWTWRDSSLSEDVQDISLSSTVRTLTWVDGTRLVAGLASNYVLVESVAGTSKDIVGPGAIGGGIGQDAGRFSGVGVSSLMGGMGPMPLATRLSEGLVLLAKDINTHFIDTEGQSIGRRQIPWPQAPDVIGYSYPYLLALQSSKGLLEIRNPETLSAFQSISLPGAKILHVPNPSVSLAHAGKGFLVASERTVWRMEALGYDAQIDSLVELEKYDEAISLLNMLEDALLTDKAGRVREIKMRKAEDLFRQKRFRPAFDIFLDVHAPPERVIGLFSTIISGDIAERNRSTDDNTSISRSSEDGRDITRQTDAKDETASLAGSLRRAQASSATDDTASVTTRAETASLRGSVRRGKPSSTSEDLPVLAGKDLRNATMELNSFLVDTRTRIQRMIDYETGNFKDARDKVVSNNLPLMCELDPTLDAASYDDETAMSRIKDIARLVDSTLFRSYMYQQSTLAGSFFRLPNAIDVEVAEEKLMEKRRYNDIIEFFYGKGLHAKALEALARFAKDDFEDEDVPEQLRGPQRLITYLQNVPPENIDLILKHIEWPMKTAPDLAMEVFIADTRNAEHLPRKKVLEYLTSVGPNFAAAYLEHVITELNEEDSELHQRLIQLYLDSLKEAQGDQKAQRLAQLTNFLKASRRYEPWRIIRILSKDEVDLREPRAIVLGRMQEHKQALEIYVFEMQDPEKAEDYCNQVWLEQHSGTEAAAGQSTRRAPTKTTATADPEADQSTVYHLLLSLYLKPRSGRKQQLAPALELLARHGSRLPANSTLTLLPEALAVTRLEDYFRGRIRAGNAVHNQARIVAGLRKTVEDSIDLDLKIVDPKGRNRSVIIQEDRICGVCHKRFGATAIKVMPNNAVVHYGCAK